MGAKAVRCVGVVLVCSGSPAIYGYRVIISAADQNIAREILLWNYAKDECVATVCDMNRNGSLLSG